MPQRARKQPESDRDLTTRLWSALGELDLPGVRAVVIDGVARLSGEVDSQKSLKEAKRVAQSIDGIKRVKSELRVTEPEERAENAPDIRIGPKDPTDVLSLVGSDDIEAEAVGDLHEDSDAPIIESLQTLSEEEVAGTEIEFNADIGTSDPAEAVEGAEPYDPPTDPVVRPTSRTAGDIRYIGGFARDSLDPSVDEAVDGDSDEPDRLQAGDAEIAEDVRMALEQDAATADLAIRVLVRDGIVYLRGTVASLDDVEFAEEIASRVPGVIEVREELEIEGI